MNLAQAVAVCLWELSRSPQAARRAPATRPPASAAELERLTALLEEILQSAGHTDYTRLCNAEEKTRRLIRRLAPDARDAAVLSGMLRQVLWKLTHPS
jgi:tRNA/rRNA methyltransferase